MVKERTFFLVECVGDTRTTIVLWRRDKPHNLDVSVAQLSHL